MARSRTPVGAHGDINLKQIAPGKWRARTLYRFEDGTRRQVERAGSTKGKAQNALLEALTTIGVPDSRTGKMKATMTVADLAEVYLETKRKEKLAPNSIRTYTQWARSNIVPQLGALRATEVRPMVVQEFCDRVTDENGAGTAYNCRKVLRGMFALALLNDVVKVNPVVGVKVFGVGDVGKAAKALPLDGVDSFLDVVRNDPAMRSAGIPDIWEFMAFTGCRIGEALALRWSHVDFEAGAITLGPSIAEYEGPVRIWEPAKTDKSLRTIIVPARTMALLRGIKERVPHTDEGLVFPHPTGKIYRPTRLEQIWERNRERLGYPEFTSHGFRKTVATMLDAAGLTAREIAEYLGHKRPSFTQDVYMSREVGSNKVAKFFDSKFGESSGSEGERDAKSA
ncbi:tyrosine-type recombinase/integrase [Leifsonia aquatica]|uniref:tyrosine-type recombinase/integrase n=1 Tax=Leifsonia aquatica TaxID=144185 RepID=UPI00046996EC|nr:site-specific integrase [Leifsonia aquatica]